MEALVLEQRTLGARLRWLTLAAPELVSAQPGQFVLLRCADADSSDPLLRRPFFIAGSDAKAGTISLFYALAGAGTRWLSRAQPGSILDLLGPAGRPIKLRSDARHVLLVAEGWAVAPLLLLAQRSSGNLLLVHQAASAELELPPYLLPAEVEYLAADGPLEQLLARPLPTAGMPPLQWSDLVVGAGGPQLAITIASAIRAARLRWPAGLAQFVLTNPLRCGIGLCGACMLELSRRGGRRLLCLEGPALDLQSIT